MKNLFFKELRLATPPLTYIFLLFGLMSFIPGYPILCGGFFICLGIFQGYQYSRESEDIGYSLLLPVRKMDIVRGKYLTVVFIQSLGFAISAAVTVCRMTVLASAPVYVSNVLMPANPVYLACLLLIFAAFNGLFLGSFWRTAYKFAGGFIGFSIAVFIIIAIGETLHHLPGLEVLGSMKGGDLPLQLLILSAAVLIYCGVTILSCRHSEESFEKLDL